MQVDTRFDSVVEVRASSFLQSEIMSKVAKWKAYYELTKPGITKMVALSAAAGFYLALPGGFSSFFQAEHLFRFLLTIIGTVLVSGGSCALNNYIERDIDKLMKRTMNRPLPSGRLQASEALVFGAALSFFGLLALMFVNFLTLFLAAITLVSYIAVYTPMKRKTTLAMLVGGIPGAFPPLGGWVAATGSVDIQGIALFFVLFFWQMPHFLSLSWMYKFDYARGGFKMYSVEDATGKTLSIQTILYTVLLIVSSISLTLIGATGVFYLVGTVILGAVFLYFGIQMFRDVSPKNAKRTLLASYLYLTGVLALMFADKL